MSFRRDFITRPIFALARGALPSMSDTEREALEAGDVWWDGELFSGNPNWAVMLAVPPAKLAPEEQAYLDGPVNERPLREWVKAGVVRTNGKPVSPDLLDKTAYLMSPGGNFGPSFLVTDNFKVLRAYNTSDLYAVFVGTLSDRVGGASDFDTPWKSIVQLPNRDVEEIQKLLKARGAAIDKLDGKIGSNTRWQIGSYQRKAGLAVDCWPTAGLLAHLRGTPVR